MKRSKQPAGLDRHLLTRYALDSALAESYRALRTNLLLGQSTPIEVLAITSDARGEGKSLTCANLGIVLSRTEQRVVIVDCDLRRPALHTRFAVAPGAWPTLLEDPKADGAKVVAQVDADLHQALDGLWVLPAGPGVDHPSELLGGAGFEHLLRHLRERFDVVLLDTPPVGVVADALVVGAMADGVAVVVDFESTSRRAAARTIRRLEDAGSNVLGTIANRAPSRGARAGDSTYARTST